mgnify:CR=1 FL=1
MSFQLLEAALPSFWILIVVFWVLRAIFGGKKKKKQQRQGGSSSESEKQPGKSITDILKELEERVSGKTESPQYEEPDSYDMPEAIEEVAPVAFEKTVADYKREKHSDMDKHHITPDKLTDGIFDDIDDKLMHLEAFELDAHKPVDRAALSIEDMRRAVVLDAILNRPQF